MLLIMLIVQLVLLMVQQTLPVLLHSSCILLESIRAFADSAANPCSSFMQVTVCSCREGSQQGRQRLLPLKPPEERWACSALFSCAAQLHTHQQFGPAITLFTAACDAAASGLVRQAQNDAHTLQACSSSHTPVVIRVFLHQVALHQVMHHHATCHLFLLQAACRSAAFLVHLRRAVE